MPELWRIEASDPARGWWNDGWENKTMCNLYESTPRERINERFAVSVPPRPYAPQVAPLQPGPIVVQHGQAHVGQWGMIPPNSATRLPTGQGGKRLSTNNARREGVARSWTFGAAWQAGRRCLIPANSFDEPCWETGRNVWWRFYSADGQPWALAGLWSEWTDPATGEVLPNFTMLTQNCDRHPLLARMHKPDATLPSDQQDKRAVVPVAAADWDAWLHGSAEQAEGLIKLPALETLRAGPVTPNPQAALF